MNRLHFGMILAPLAALTLSGCLIVAGPGPDPSACGEGRVQHLIGQPEAALSSVTLTGPVRVIHPGQPVTLDLIPARLNIKINALGRIASTHCG